VQPPVKLAFRAVLLSYLNHASTRLSTVAFPFFVNLQEIVSAPQRTIHFMPDDQRLDLEEKSTGN
jgi:hypothetical protein